MLNVTTERFGDVLAVDVEGRIDSENYGRFLNAVKSEVAERDRAVIVNMERLVYIGSEGLRAHLATARSLRERDAKLLFCCVADHIRGVFEMSGMDKIGTFFATKNDALASLNLPQKTARRP